MKKIHLFAVLYPSTNTILMALNYQIQHKYKYSPSPYVLLGIRIIRQQGLLQEHQDRPIRNSCSQDHQDQTATAF